MNDQITVVKDTFAEGRDLMKRIIEQNEEIVKMNSKMVEVLTLPPMVSVPFVVGCDPAGTDDKGPDGGKDFTWSGRRGD